MNRAQRVILSIAIGAALIAAAAAINAQIVGETTGGWFMYEPNAIVISPLASTNDYLLQQLGVWLLGIAFWRIVCWRLFRTRDE